MIVTKILPSVYFRGDNQPQNPQKPLVQSDLKFNQQAVLKSADAIDIDRLKDLSLKNFRLIDSNSVRGACLTSARDEVFKSLKDAGILTIVDLRREAGQDSKYARKCAMNGIEYFGMPINDSMPVYCNLGYSNCSAKEFKNQNHIFAQQLSKLFNLLDRGQVYIGCQLGIHRTDLAVVTNYLLNPKEPSSPPLLSHIFHKEENMTNKRIGAVKNLYRNITEADKQMLGIAGDFYNSFLLRITKLRMQNLK